MRLCEKSMKKNSKCMRGGSLATRSPGSCVEDPKTPLPSLSVVKGEGNSREKMWQRHQRQRIAERRRFGGKDQSSSSRRRQLAAVACGSLGLLVVCANFDMHLPSTFDSIRRKLSGKPCIHNIYATREEAVALPPVPSRETNYLPSYIKMCYQWMYRNAYPDLQHLDFLVRENEDICMDWTAPHFAMMEIVASSILNSVLAPAVQYRHLCSNYRTYTGDGALLQYDWTPIQTVFQEAVMPADTSIFAEDVTDLESQCKAALMSYNPTNDALRIKSRALYHPFSMPKDSIMYDAPITLTPVSTPTELTWLPEYPTATSQRLAPISAVARPLRKRLHTTALNWAPVTDQPPLETVAGTVIMIDPNSYRMDPSLFIPYIPPQVTSISILSPPLCATSNLPTGQLCLDYADELLNYFNTNYVDNPSYPNMGSGGATDPPPVTAKIAGSTSGLFARPMTANTLLCPPNTLSCLLPSLGKIPEPIPPEPPIPDPPMPSTVLFDVPEATAPTVFTDKVGRCGETPSTSPETCTKVIQLATVDPPVTMDPVVENTSDEPENPYIAPTITGDPVAPSYIEAQKTTDPAEGDGMPTNDPNVEPTSTVDPVEAATTPYTEVLDQTEVPPEVQEKEETTETADPSEPVNSPIGNTETTTVVDSTETTPTTEEVTTAVNNNEPINTNVLPSESEVTENLSPQEATQELVATEDDTGLTTTVLDPLAYANLVAERFDSQERIALENFVSTEHQIYCPDETPTGNVQELDGGYTMVDDGTYTTFSDTNGIVTFNSPVTITTYTPQQGEFVDPYTNETYIADYVTIYDNVLQDYVNVTGSTVSTNGSSLVVEDSVGNLYVDPSTLQGSLLLDGAAVDLSTADNSHTLIEGTVVGVGENSVPLTPQGTTVISDGGGYETVGETDPGGFTQDTNPADTPMAPAEIYQMPPDTNSDEFVERKLDTYDTCITTPVENAIHIEDHAQIAGQVTFDVYQVYKGSSISWVAVDIVTPSSTEECKKVNEINPGLHSGMSGFTAVCDPVTNKAIVDVYIHDGNKKIGQSDGVDKTHLIPERCEPSQDIKQNNKCYFQYEISCPVPIARRRLQDMQAMSNDGRRFGAIVNAVPTGSRRILVENGQEEEPLFGGSNVFGECTQRHTVVDGKDVFNHYKFGGGVQNQMQTGAYAYPTTERGLRGPNRKKNQQILNVNVV